MNWYQKQSKPIKALLWILGVPVGLAFFPITIGLGLIYLMTKKMKPTKLRTAGIIVLAALTLFVGSAWASVITDPQQPAEPGEATEEQKPADNQPVEVVKVVDGDTLDVRINGKTERLRLIGIDTPETVDPRKAVQCFGVEASNKAKELLEGKMVTLEADPEQGERDKYKRLLRYIFLPDGQSFNKLMISEGYAYEYTYETPYKYQAEYKQAQKDAEANKKGLWADKVCDSKADGTKYEELKSEGKISNDSPASETKTTDPVVAPVVPPKSNPAPKPAPAPHQDKNCDDFATQAEAQAYFEANGGSATNNVDGLDRNRDGVACETLP